MKTKDLIITDEALIAPQLKLMKVKELEKHAKKILGLLGSEEYDAVIASVIKLIPQLDSASKERFVRVQNLIKAQVASASNDDAHEDNLIERLSVILMVIVSKKFEKIMGKH